MANYNVSTQERIADINRGLRVTKAGFALGATGDKDLFVVKGGAIALLGLVGVCDGAMEGKASKLLVKCTPASGSGTALSIASDSISAKAAGTMFTLPADNGDGLVISTGISAARFADAPVYYVRPCKIELEVVDQSNTGVVSWHLWYVPMEDGAYVEPA